MGSAPGAEPDCKLLLQPQPSPISPGTQSFVYALDCTRLMATNAS